MKRVAALCLPHWPIERLRRAGPIAAPPEAATPSASLARLARQPGEGHWRPGARWAQGESDSRPVPPPDSAQGEALVTSTRVGNRNLVAAASPEALALGLVPGMAITQARVLVPRLDIRPADPEGDETARRALAIALARRWSPVVAHGEEGVIFLDLTGVAHLFGGEEAMARRLFRLLARLGHSARIAVADTPGAAWALVQHTSRAVTVCPPARHAEAIASLPPEALRIEGPAAELLRRLGVIRIGTLAAMPRAPLVRRFGFALAQRLEQALGNLPEPLEPVVPPQLIAVGRRFAEPILTAEAIAHWLGRLAPDLAQALAEAGQGARMVELVADRVDGVPQLIRIGLARASRDPAHLVRLLARRIESIEPGYGIDAITLHVRRAEPLGPEELAERLDAETGPDLAPLVDTLATRIGHDRLWRCAPLESDVPERSVRRTGALDPPESRGARPKPDDVRQLDRAPPMPPWHHRWPRPARLLRRPERVDDVMALMPDHPPRRFTWRGETHRIVRADGPERVHGEWWKRLTEVHSVRDYFRVEDEQGRRYWLFRSGDGERDVTGDRSWYLHGVFG
ncbi:DNA polymerase Y family protein [Sphingomonas sp.]|uniref:Y-family DNA polymerase n=1 Tax=Sphingomonas sp. TaxID=28214 RepID=UPI001B1F7B38|nr:DNA polymerase Y family protein [Sphingomonas sp.]MBO9714710.1 DNA polymerase Y family protein [Sphingomonas sp.]